MSLLAGSQLKSVPKNHDTLRPTDPFLQPNISLRALIIFSAFENGATVVHYFIFPWERVNIHEVHL